MCASNSKTKMSTINDVFNLCFKIYLNTLLKEYTFEANKL